jgi:hypothetical protein
MFVVQAIVPDPELFAMFQKLSAQGSNVIKYPRTGHASKKMFRFSYVEGSIYLTWKGKYGNQGVDLAEVTEVNLSLPSNIQNKISIREPTFSTELCLSIMSGEKSIDLTFSSKEERERWKVLLDLLSAKERGYLPGFNQIVTKPNEEVSLEELILCYSSLSEIVIPKNRVNELLAWVIK